MSDRDNKLSAEIDRLREGFAAEAYILYAQLFAGGALKALGKKRTEIIERQIVRMIDVANGEAAPRGLHNWRARATEALIGLDAERPA